MFAIQENLAVVAQGIEESAYLKLLSDPSYGNDLVADDYLRWHRNRIALDEIYQGLIVMDKPEYRALGAIIENLQLLGGEKYTEPCTDSLASSKKCQVKLSLQTLTFLDLPSDLGEKFVQGSVLLPNYEVLRFLGTYAAADRLVTFTRIPKIDEDLLQRFMLKAEARARRKRW